MDWKSDLTDHDGLRSMASRSASRGLEAEESKRTRPFAGLILLRDTNLKTTGTLDHGRKAIVRADVALSDLQFYSTLSMRVCRVSPKVVLALTYFGCRAGTNKATSKQPNVQELDLLLNLY